MAGLMEKADELGGLLARTDEYQALRRAMSRANEDRDVVEERNALMELEGFLMREMQAGRQPDEEKAKEYEERMSRLQTNSTFQGLIAAQENFDKVMRKVNDAIAAGMEKGAESRIIMPT